MIQTADQYIFLYRTLIEGILTIDTNISLQEYLNTKKFRMDVKNQYKVIKKLNQKLKINIFLNQLLEQLQTTIEYSYRGALDPANINKNRIETILARMFITFSQ